MPASKSQKTRKHGRNLKVCEAYRRDDRRAKNADARQARHERKLEKIKARSVAKATD